MEKKDKKMLNSLFKEVKKIELIETTVKVFDMNSISNLEGLIVLNPTSLSLNNRKFIESYQRLWLDGRLIPKELLHKTSFVAYYNRGFSKKILILRNRFSGETGVFDYA